MQLKRGRYVEQDEEELTEGRGGKKVATTTERTDLDPGLANEDVGAMDEGLSICWSVGLHRIYFEPRKLSGNGLELLIKLRYSFLTANNLQIT